MLNIDNIESVRQYSTTWKPSDVAFIKRIVWSEGDVEILAWSQEQKVGESWPDFSGDYLEILFRFVSVSDLRIKFDSVGAPQQVTGFEINDVSENGMERIRFEVGDYENGIIGFGCRQIRVEEARMADSI